MLILRLSLSRNKTRNFVSWAIWEVQTGFTVGKKSVLMQCLIIRLRTLYGILHLATVRTTVFIIFSARQK